MAELVDALDSGSSEVTLMEVQILLAAPKNIIPVSTFLLIGAGVFLCLFAKHVTCFFSY